MKPYINPYSLEAITRDTNVFRDLFTWLFSRFRREKGGYPTSKKEKHPSGRFGGSE